MDVVTTFEQGFLITLLLVVLVLFVWGRFRYDIVAFAALLAATLAGSVPAGDMFSGFAHPATVTVALVLIVSRGLRNSGAIDAVAGNSGPRIAGPPCGGAGRCWRSVVILHE